MPFLKWISDADLIFEVRQLLSIAKEAKKTAFEEFGKNVIDPFAALFEMSGFETDFNTWVKSETSRQAQKTLQNHIGDFHQNILGYAKGWHNLRVGKEVDLESIESKTIAEIKNKYNTISGGKLSDLYYSLEKLVSQKSSVYKGFTAYYVAIIPKNGKRYDRLFTPSDRGKGEKCPQNEHIREIDGASFYSLVTASDSALEDLFDVLPLVIRECTDRAHSVNDNDKLKEFFDLAFS